MTKPTIERDRLSAALLRHLEPRDAECEPSGTRDRIEFSRDIGPENAVASRRQACPPDKGAEQREELGALYGVAVAAERDGLHEDRERTRPHAWVMDAAGAVHDLARLGAAEVYCFDSDERKSLGDLYTPAPLTVFVGWDVGGSLAAHGPTAWVEGTARAAGLGYAIWAVTVQAGFAGSVLTSTSALVNGMLATVRGPGWRHGFTLAIERSSTPPVRA